MQAHRLGLHQAGDVLDLGRGHLPALLPQIIGQLQPAQQPLVQEGPDRRHGEQRDDAGLALHVHALAGRQDAEHLVCGCPECSAVCPGGVRGLT